MKELFANSSGLPLSPLAAFVILVGALLLFGTGCVVAPILFARLPWTRAHWAARLETLRARAWSSGDVLALILPLVAVHALFLALAARTPQADTLPSAPRIIASLAISVSAFHGLALLLIAVLLRRRHARWADAFGLARAGLARQLAAGAVTYFALVPFVLTAAVVYLVILLLCGYRPEQQPVMALFLKTDSLAVQIAVAGMAVVVAPIAEELIFRGVAYPFLLRHLHPVPATLGMALLFALVHMSVPAIVPICVLALGLGLLYLHTGSLAACMALHAVFNGVSLAAALIVKTGMPGA